ncbi:indolepyruvate ferredoxin oxidoreductase subunit alpha [Vulcanisaeta souniana]|uniref:Indolepyruvate oxidoreductase subunit IorA n=1 Tax=Vulcanisaeta souniana JCM 11219 TaxID=1293586 RepID=A0A830DZA0_9CREN|nr:indolepyruvate ferredoxin oxidoreductase subunit alpha [Vulcanisaeta souniana]BDR92174.1 indolepyruvate ferredoxin oxidoreductase [Vulcanisaeta souniana JCM 11219]GGI67351.1 indolepyruvate ferredoxin oxidoreductase [Vulcanisaeta souniana JCM 11219]
MSNCIIRLMLGNHAIAHGAMEAGIAVAAGYPGTPSSEIIEYLLDNGREFGVYAEWSSNEKVAYEVAYGAALAGARSIVTMKHVGLNVAMDPLMSSAYTGVKGGFVIITADDPGMWSSQNEQDNRWVGLHAYIPVFEPYDPQNAKDLVKLALEFSERHGHPVMMRTVTRVSHVRGPVTVCSPEKPRYSEGYVKEPRRHALVPANARTLKGELLRRWSTIEEDVEDAPHVYIDGNKNLIITSGVAFTYALEAVKNYGVKASILNVVTPVPLPRKVITDAVTRADKVIVIEEGDPVLEQQLKALLYDEDIRVPIMGKMENLFNRVGELTINSVMDGLTKALGIVNPLTSIKTISIDYSPPQRPPVFCPGCPHAASFYELKVSTARSGARPVFSGDIGCYSLGINNPFNEQDLLTNMGSSLGLGMGIYHGTNGKTLVIPIIGDSTFFHTGLPALVNAVYNKTPMLILILDNRVTAMTGGQPNPTSMISIENIAKAVGVDYVRTIDPFDTKKAQDTITEAMSVVKGGGVAVIIMRRGCALEATRLNRGHVARYYVDANACRACGICYNLIACPAIVPLENRKAWIDPNMCVGCSVCAQVCPYNAIKPEGNVKEWLGKWAEM